MPETGRCFGEWLGDCEETGLELVLGVECEAAGGVS
jgi:hypothetical protein